MVIGQKEREKSFIGQGLLFRTRSTAAYVCISNAVIVCHCQYVHSLLTGLPDLDERTAYTRIGRDPCEKSSNIKKAL